MNSKGLITVDKDYIEISKTRLYKRINVKFKIDNGILKKVVNSDYILFYLLKSFLHLLCIAYILVLMLVFKYDYFDIKILEQCIFFIIIEFINIFFIKQITTKEAQKIYDEIIKNNVEEISKKYDICNKYQLDKDLEYMESKLKEIGTSPIMIERYNKCYNNEIETVPKTSCTYCHHIEYCNKH